MAYNPILPLPAQPWPLTNVTPFTYRDGMTFEKLLQILLAKMESVVGELNAANSENYAKVIETLNAAIATINEKLESQTVEFDDLALKLMEDVQEAIDAVINGSVETNDTLISTVISTPDTTTRELLDTLYQPVNTVADPPVAGLITDTDSATRLALNGLYQAINTVSDAAVAAHANTPGSGTRSAIDAAIVDSLKSWGINSVVDYGADATGATDSTLAFQEAVNDGGMLYVPAGEYLIDGVVNVPGNRAIVGAGTIRKRAASASSAVVFAIVGGGGSVDNVSITGLTFVGEAPAIGCNAVWAHRVTSLTVTNCKFVDSVALGHAIDLQGCNGVSISACEFKGAQAPVGSGREYVEAIQIDASCRTGSPIPEYAGQLYDGTPTSNVSITECRFTKNGAKFAPRATGGHSAVENRYYRNIVFERNYVETPQEASSFPSVLTFPASIGVRVMNNIFNIEGGKNFVNVVAFPPLVSWIALANVNNTAGTSPASEPMRGMLNTVSANQYPSGYAVSSNEGLSIAPNAPFILYGLGDTTGIFAYYAVGMWHISGAVTLTSAEATGPTNITGNTGLVVFTLPRELWPKRIERFICGGSGSATYRLIIERDGRVIISNYSVVGTTTPLVQISASWV